MKTDVSGKAFHEAMDLLEGLFPLHNPVPEDFDRAVATVAALRDLRAIPRVLALIADDCPYSGLMGSLLGSLQVFEPQELVPAFVSGAAEFRARAPRSYLELLGLIVVTPGYRDELAAALALIPTKQRLALIDDVRAAVVTEADEAATAAFFNALERVQ